MEKKIPHQWKEVICQFWESDASHPSTDSTRGEVKKKIGHNQFLCHRRQIMTKTYREAYADFRAMYPEIKVSETTFRRYKPFYV